MIDLHPIRGITSGEASDRNRPLTHGVYLAVGCFQWRLYENPALKAACVSDR
jgi:hypothetical protein